MKASVSIMEALNKSIPDFSEREKRKCDFLFYILSFVNAKSL